MAAFTQKWFTCHEKRWKHLLNGLRGKAVTALEIGTFEGRAALWLLENVLTHPQARMVCVDPHTYDAERKITGTGPKVNGKFSIEAAHAQFLKNTEPWRPHKLTYIRAETQEGLHQMTYGEQFDFVYIDGSHIASMVLTDAVSVWPFLKTGGLVTFDDYKWRLRGANHMRHLWEPALGIDAFLSVFETRYEMIEKSSQVTIRKLS